MRLFFNHCRGAKPHTGEPVGWEPCGFGESELFIVVLCCFGSLHSLSQKQLAGQCAEPHLTRLAAVTCPNDRNPIRTARQPQNEPAPARAPAPQRGKDHGEARNLSGFAPADTPRPDFGHSASPGGGGSPTHERTQYENLPWDEGGISERHFLWRPFTPFADIVNHLTLDSRPPIRGIRPGTSCGTNQEYGGYQDAFSIPSRFPPGWPFRPMNIFTKTRKSPALATARPDSVKNMAVVFQRSCAQPSSVVM